MVGYLCFKVATLLVWHEKLSPNLENGVRAEVLVPCFV